jgi:hypothetical protein
MGNNDLPASADATEPTPLETLELLQAFNRIADPHRKRAVILLAQQLAMGSPHFTRTLAHLLRNH